MVGDAGRAPGLGPLAVRDVRLGPMERLERGLDVDERVRRQQELDLRSSGQQLGADDAAQLREQHAEPRVVVGSRLLAVDGDEQLVTLDPAVPVEHEVGEQELAQQSRQGVLDPLPLEPHHEPAAELDPRLTGRRHPTSLERSAKRSGNEEPRLSLVTTTEGGAMGSRNVETYRQGTKPSTEGTSTRWSRSTPRASAGSTRPGASLSGLPRSSRTTSSEGWIQASSDCQVTDARYTDAGETVVARFTCRGTNDGQLGPFPATGKEWTLPICEMWHFDADGRVIGGEIYYDQVSLLLQLGLLPELEPVEG